MGISHVLQQLQSSAHHSTQVCTLCNQQAVSVLCYQHPGTSCSCCMIPLLYVLRTLRPYLLLNRPQA